MPRNSTRVPSYRRHKATGQAVVTLNGKDHYLGKFGSAASRAAYDRLVGTWQVAGRRLLEPDSGGITVKELILAYWRHAERFYRKDGKATSQVNQIKLVLKTLRESYGGTLAASFGPLSLKVLREKWVAQKLARDTVNTYCSHVKRAFRWGTEQELVPPSVFHGLQAVRGLAQGRTTAPDHPPVGPVADDLVERTLPHLRPNVAAMVSIQRLTGMRPGEVVIMRPVDIDRSGAVWIYTPTSHKTEHRGRERSILIGPAAQVILLPWIVKAEGRSVWTEYLFPPPPNVVAKTRKGRHKGHASQPGPHYSGRTYGAAIRRTCDQRGIPRWSPNQLRHSAATRIRKEFGLEAAQVILGHSKADVTQLYAERDTEKARAVVAKIG